MIKLIELPTIAMDVVMYTGTITSPETTESAIQWILQESKQKRTREARKGIIEVTFFNHALREPIEIRYSGDFLMGKVPDDVSKYSVVDISAKWWGRSGNFNYTISVMDPESREYSGLHDDEMEDI